MALITDSVERLEEWVRVHPDGQVTIYLDEEATGGRQTGWQVRLDSERGMVEGEDAKHVGLAAMIHQVLDRAEEAGL